MGRLIPAGTGFTKNILDNKAKDEDKIRIAELKKQELAKQNLEKTEKSEKDRVNSKIYVFELITY